MRGGFTPLPVYVAKNSAFACVLRRPGLPSGAISCALIRSPDLFDQLTLGYPPTFCLGRDGCAHIRQNLGVQLPRAWAWLTARFFARGAIDKPMCRTNVIYT